MYPFTFRESREHPIPGDFQTLKEKFFEELEKAANEEKSKYYPVLSRKHISLSRNDEGMEFNSYGGNGMPASEGTNHFSQDGADAVISFSVITRHILLIVFLVPAIIAVIIIFKMGWLLSIIASLGILGFALVAASIEYGIQKDRISSLVNRAWQNSIRG